MKGFAVLTCASVQTVVLDHRPVLPQRRVCLCERSRQTCGVPAGSFSAAFGGLNLWEEQEGQLLVSASSALQERHQTQIFTLRSPLNPQRCQGGFSAITWITTSHQERPERGEERRGSRHAVSRWVEAPLGCENTRLPSLVSVFQAC